MDWESLEDAFENNAPEVHSYLHLTTGEVLRVVDGVADPQMHVRIASDGNYLRIDPVSSREQYRWMERFIPMVEDLELKDKLTQAIDGKGAFRRFKDVLMSYGAEREKWFTFRSERLRTFMEAWLSAHAIHTLPRPQWAETARRPDSEVLPDSASRVVTRSGGAEVLHERPAHPQRRGEPRAPPRGSSSRGSGRATSTLWSPSPSSSRRGAPRAASRITTSISSRSADRGPSSQRGAKVAEGVSGKEGGDA